MLKQTEEDETEQVTPVTALTPYWTSPTPITELQTIPTPALVLANSKDLMRKLASRNALVRAEAERQIKSMDVPSLLALMTCQRQQRNQRLIGVVTAIMINLVVLPVLAFWMHTPSVFMFWSFITIALAASGVAFTQTQKFVALALAETEDLNAVGELIAALEMRDEQVQQAIRPVLTRLLPRLHAQHSSLLNADARRMLHLFMEGRLLERRFGRQQPTAEEIPLLLAVLKALEQVGDASFLPVVKEWASGQHRGSNPRIQQAAQDCLPYLKLCSTNRQVSQEMLRASALDPALDARDLLRPASDTEGASSENLLRPSEPDHLLS